MTMKDFVNGSTIFKTDESIRQVEVVLDEIGKLATLTDQDWFFMNRNGLWDERRTYFGAGMGFAAAIGLVGAGAAWAVKKVRNKKVH